MMRDQWLMNTRWRVREKVAEEPTTHSSLVYTQLSLDTHSRWKLGYTATKKS